MSFLLGSLSQQPTNGHNNPGSKERKEAQLLLLERQLSREVNETKIN